MASKRVLVVDDSRTQVAIWKSVLEKRYGEKVRVETYTDPREAVKAFGPDVDLLLLDWEMPGMDGMEVLREAEQRGVNLKRVIVLSARSADELHEAFDSTGVLAKIEKEEPAQQEALFMILDSIMKR